MSIKRKTCIGCNKEKRIDKFPINNNYCFDCIDDNKKEHDKKLDKHKKNDSSK